MNAAAVESTDKNRLSALIQQAQGQGDALDALDQQPGGAPDAKAYESHSSGILDTLEDMKEKAMAMRHEAQVAEMNAKHNFELLAQSLNDAIKNDSKIMAEQKAGKAQSEEAKSLAEGDLAAASKALATAEKDLKDLSTDCQEKAADWAESQAGRAQELQALVDAKKIISETTGGAEAQAYGLVETGSRAASTKDAGDQVLTMLQSLQEKSGDVALQQLGNRVQAELMAG